MKKPELNATTSPDFLDRLKIVVQTITGRRGGRLSLPSLTSADAVGAAPTKAEFDALRADLIATRSVLSSLISRLDD
jgi:hypothetical protein